MNYMDFIDTSLEKKTCSEPDIISIGKESYIQKSYYKFRGKEFCEISFYINGKEKFLGKFYREENNLFPVVEYKDGKILIGHKVYNNKEFKYSKVYNLYNILDDMSYSLTEKEAIEKFDSSIDTSLLKTPNKLINRQDLEKIKRI